ncbi:MAG: polymorphic toxin-type HINT domain-containing protein, partial [Bacteroidota bacterium]
YEHTETACLGTPYIDAKTNPYRINGGSESITDSLITGFPFFDSNQGGVNFELGRILLSHPALNINADDPVCTTSPASINHNGDGSFAAFDLLLPIPGRDNYPGYASYPPFIENENSIPLDGSSTSTHIEESTSALLFLKFWENKAEVVNTSDLSGDRVTPYVFVHAQQIAQYPGFFETCQFEGNDLNHILSLANPVTWDSLYNKYRVRNQILASLSGGNQTTGGNENMDEALSSMANNELRNDYFNRWVEAETSIYQRFENAYNQSGQNTFFDTLSSPLALVNYLSAWEDDPCSFASLTIGKRMKAIEVLISDPIFINSTSRYQRYYPDVDEQPLYSGILGATIPEDNLGSFLYSDNDQEFLLNHLLKTTTHKDDRNAILNYLFGDDFYSDPSLFFQIKGQLNDVWLENFSYDKNGYVDFINIITSWIIEDKYLGNLPVFQEIPRNEENPTQYDQHFPHGRFVWNGSNIVVFEEDIEVHYLGHFPIDYLSIDNLLIGEYEGSTLPIQNNKIELNTSFELYSNSNFSKTYSSRNEKKPQDLVVVRFVSDYEIPIPGYPQGVEAKDYIIVPAIFAEMLIRQQNDAELTRTVRSSANVIGFVLGVATLGSSSTVWGVLSQADLLYTTADEAIFNPAEYEQSTTGNSFVSQELQRYWQNTGFALLGANVVAGLGSGINKLFKVSTITDDGILKNRVDFTINNAGELLDFYRLQYAEDLPQYIREVENLIAVIEEIKRLAISSGNISPAAIDDLAARIQALKIEKTIAFDISSNIAEYRVNINSTTKEVKITTTLNDTETSISGNTLGTIVSDDNSPVELLVHTDALTDGSSGTTIGSVRNIRIRTSPESPPVLLQEGELYNLGTGTYKLKIISTQPLSTDFPNWQPFLFSPPNRNWTTVWNNYFLANGSTFGPFVSNLSSDEISKLQLYMGGWSEAQMLKFLEYPDETLFTYFLHHIDNWEDFNQLTGMDRVRFWGKLFDAEDNFSVTIDQQLINRLAEQMMDNPIVWSYLNESTEAIKIWKAINRVPLIHPGSHNQETLDWIQHLVIRGDIEASVEESNTILRYFDNGQPHEIGRILSDGQLSLSNTLSASAYALDDIKMIYSSPLTDGHIPANPISAAIICNGTTCELIQGACFPAGTPIQTPSGIIPIEEISIGDTVIAFDESQQDTILATVNHTFSKVWQKMVQIVIGSDTIMATNNHPFYIPALRRYLPADSLRRQMKLLTLAGTLLTVQSATALDTTIQVYNFEVDEHHNYFVGEEGVLVHNDCYLVQAGLFHKPGTPTFDVVDDALGSSPDGLLKRWALIEDLKTASSADDEFIAFFRAEEIVDEAERLVVQRDRVKAWEVARQFTDPTEISLLTRLANDMGDRPNLAAIITSHVDPNGAFSTWNRVSSGERFIAEAKFYNVMDELVSPGVDYDFIWIDPNTGESFTWGAPTSGLRIYSNAPEGTFIIGGFGPDLKFILPQFPTATIGDPVDLVLPDHVNQLNGWISAGFPQPIGSQFNLLNVYDPLFVHVLNNPQELVTYGVFTDRGAGQFFTFINGPWMDAAVQQNQFILVASNVSDYVYETPTKLTGFGKEIHRLEWIHGYRFNPSNNTMVPPSEATGLSALTREGDLDHGF